MGAFPYEHAITTSHVRVTCANFGAGSDLQFALGFGAGCDSHWHRFLQESGEREVLGSIMVSG